MAGYLVEWTVIESTSTTYQMFVEDAADERDAIAQADTYQQMEGPEGYGIEATDTQYAAHTDDWRATEDDSRG